MSTPRFQIPYPAPSDPADVPADLQALATAVDAIPVGQLVPMGRATSGPGLALPPSVNTFIPVAPATTTLRNGMAINASGDGFIVPRAGWYRVQCTISLQPVAGANGYAQISLFQNGNPISGGTGGWEFIGTTSYRTVLVYDDVSCAANDLIQTAFGSGVGAAMTLNGSIFIVEYM
jgi:hypothetical protein